jgi:hypothetical protein
MKENQFNSFISFRKQLALAIFHNKEIDCFETLLRTNKIVLEQFVGFVISEANLNFVETAVKQQKNIKLKQSFESFIINNNIAEQTTKIISFAQKEIKMTIFFDVPF